MMQENSPKASYMVPPQQHRLNGRFAAGTWSDHQRTCFFLSFVSCDLSFMLFLGVATHCRSIFALRVCLVGLDAGGFRSWLPDSKSSTKWMAARWGDVYAHETLISHIRRLLDSEFAAKCFPETFAQFRCRMPKVEAHLNSDAFASKGGRGLEGLVRSPHDRCENDTEREGARLPY